VTGPRILVDMILPERGPTAGPPARVVICGGGFAAVEAMVALRDLCGPRVQVTVVSPRTTLDYRPAATVESFDHVHPLRYDLRAIAGDLGATYRRDALAAVAARAGHVRLASFAQLRYDALILALGTQPRASVPGAITFRDQRDLSRVRRMLAEIESGAVRRLVFAVPVGVSWPLPLYELALLSAARVQAGALDVELALVTPERAPMEILGTRASELVGGLLAERGVRFHGSCLPARVCRQGRLELHFGGSVRADRVIAVPELMGRRIAGVPASWNGFVPVDAHGRVALLGGVFAAGDMTTSPLKLGAAATHHADVIAHAIATRLGCTAQTTSPQPPVFRVRLMDGDRALLLHVALDEQGRPVDTEATLHGVAPAPLSAKVPARYLRPYLATRHPLTV
jgi:sulfide:quinone oxidoreductase